MTQPFDEMYPSTDDEICQEISRRYGELPTDVEYDEDGDYLHVVIKGEAVVNPIKGLSKDLRDSFMNTLLEGYYYIDN